MTWVVRQADVHKCAVPVHKRGDGVTTGDVWECDECGTRHVVRVHTDQRDGGAWFSWEQVDPYRHLFVAWKPGRG